MAERGSVQASTCIIKHLTSECLNGRVMVSTRRPRSCAQYCTGWLVSLKVQHRADQLCKLNIASLLSLDSLFPGAELRCVFSGPTKRARPLRTSNTKNTLRAAQWSATCFERSVVCRFGQVKQGTVPVQLLAGDNFFELNQVRMPAALQHPQLSHGGDWHACRVDNAEFYCHITHHVLDKLFSSCRQH